MFIVLLFILFLPFSVFGAVSSEECLGCHDGFKSFVHGRITCQDCHIDTTSLPHKEKLAKPSCNTCHQTTTKTHSNSVHGIGMVECKNCHNVHADDKSTKTCNDCHTKTSHCALPSKEKHLAALTCVSCHGNSKGEHLSRSEFIAKDRWTIKKEVCRSRRNNTVDHGEWDHSSTPP